MRDGLRLKDGSVVAVIGGGPAGCACAITLMREASRRGMVLRVVLFEGKDFQVHYNQCVGVLSPPLTSILDSELDISLPRELIKREIAGYRLHSSENEILLLGKNGTSPTYAVRRLMFDNFLIQEAEKAGVEVIRSRVSDVEFVGKPSPEEVRIYSESCYLRADAVVGAFGLDDGMLSAFERSTAKGAGYRRPKKYLRSFVTKLHADVEFIDRQLGDIIYAFLMPRQVGRVEFGAITPKGDHITINIVGERVTSLDMDLFLELPAVRAHLPPFHNEELHYFGGRFPTAPAKNPYGDRFVMVGDATGWMRPFKGKGVNTALLTGIRAARTMVERGLKADDFRFYARACHELLDDYYFGVGVRLFCKLTSRGGIFDRLVELAKTDPTLYDSLYDSVSGQDTYRRIIRRQLNPGLFKRLGAAVFGAGPA